MNNVVENSFNDINREHDACGVGFVANLNNKPEHKLVEYAIKSIKNISHRGGREDDEKMSDGSGILTSIPIDFFKQYFPEIENSSNWGIGSFFLPPDLFMQKSLMDIVEATAIELGFTIKTKRSVAVDLNILSRKVLANLPDFWQLLFIQNEPKHDIEAALFVLRKQIEKKAFKFLAKHRQKLSSFHIPSLSSQTIVYKGILPGKNLALFYPDLADRDFKVRFAIFHERFSTNTKPSWNLAQPFRCLAHNGEINTIRGNTTQMGITEKALNSSVLGDDLNLVLPCIEPAISDSGAFDNVYELLLRNDYSPTHAMMSMISEPVGDIFSDDEDKVAFYRYNNSVMEPWDGPTTMVYTDGKNRIGARLDRNGLRPCRYSVTDDGVLILSSEVGVLDLPQTKYVSQGQLAPRELFLVDLESGKIASSDEIAKSVFSAFDYKSIVAEKQHVIKNSDSVYEKELEQDKNEYYKLFGYTEKDHVNTITSMILGQQEPVGAMGLDLPLAVLSHKPQSLFNYFKQLFAQVTNPSIDPIREKMSMSLDVVLGEKENIFQNPKDSKNHYYLESPFLFFENMQEIENNAKLPAKRLDCCVAASSNFEAFSKALEELCSNAEKMVEGGCKILILSDKATSREQMPMPILLVLAAVHQHLITKELRHKCSIIAESGQMYEVMHMALMFAFGANALYPYGAYNAVEVYLNDNKLAKAEASYGQCLAHYKGALEKGILKVLGRLGISVLSSFTGAQCFEALGLHPELINAYFSGVYSRIGGIGLVDVYEENKARYNSYIDATGIVSKEDKRLWKREVHSALRKAVVENDYNLFKDYTDVLYKQVEGITLRSTYKFKEQESIDISEVEPVEKIVSRLSAAPMSLGALSKESHEAIAQGCNNAGASSNCGEGGEETARTLSRDTNDDLCSRIRQIASGRFGVTAEYLAHADEVQIKIAQGAKPGEGGQLPAAKVTDYIAKVRHTKPGVSLISPPPHHDIYSIEDLAQLIYDIKKLRKGLRVAVKLVAQYGIGTVAVGVVKAGADNICISGHDGGTGAAPLSSLYHVGIPWEIGLAEVHQALINNAMRHRVRLQADGQIHSGRDAMVAFMLGADEVTFGTSLLVTMGCIVCRQCNKGLCPVGICTQDEKIREAKFKGSHEHVTSFLKFISNDIQKYLADLGVKKVDDIIGCGHLLEINQELLPNKAKSMDMSLLFQDLPYIKPSKDGSKMPAHTIEIADWEEDLLDMAKASLKQTTPTSFHQKVKNTERAIGTNIAGMMALTNKKYDDNTINLYLDGVAGQSLAAFAPKGLSVHLNGAANDYVGKGLCGGKITITPAHTDASADLQKQSIIGNVALYGATSGKLFVCGQAGERFAIRNSGAETVVEGVGDHACEYMTGGVVVILGGLGYNFAAGMSGGTTYIYNMSKENIQCRTNTVIKTSEFKEDDETVVKSLLEEHLSYTESCLAKDILADWQANKSKFVKYCPTDHA